MIGDRRCKIEMDEGYRQARPESRQGSGVSTMKRSVPDGRVSSGTVGSQSFGSSGRAARTQPPQKRSRSSHSRRPEVMAVSEGVTRTARAVKSIPDFSPAACDCIITFRTIKSKIWQFNSGDLCQALNGTVSSWPRESLLQWRLEDNRK
jgi:hypothetical protein